MGEFLDVELGEGADNSAVNHAAEHAGGVLDGFAAAELDFECAQKHGVAAQFADADFKRDARAGGGLGEEQGPDFAGQRERVVAAALLLHTDGGGEDVFHVLPRHFLQAQEMFHGDSSAATDSIRPTASAASRRDKFNGGSRRMTRLPAGTANRPA